MGEKKQIKFIKSIFNTIFLSWRFWKKPNLILSLYYNLMFRMFYKIANNYNATVNFCGLITGVIFNSVNLVVITLITNESYLIYMTSNAIYEV